MSSIRPWRRRACGGTSFSSSTRESRGRGGPPGRLPRPSGLLSYKPSAIRLFQPFVAGKDVVDAIGFAPAHQLVAGKAGIGAQDNADGGPGLADLRGDPRNLLHRARDGIDVGAPQLCRQQVPAAEDVERQVAVAVIVAVEEFSFLSGSSVASRSSTQPTPCQGPPGTDPQTTLPALACRRRSCDSVSARRGGHAPDG